MLIIIIPGLFLLGSLHVFGQNASDSIRVSQGLSTRFWKTGYDKPLTMRQLLDITKTNKEAYNEMRIARSYRVVSSIFGMPGGFLLGWPLGTAAAGGEANWALAGIGAGLIVVGIPLSAASVKHARNAVRIYNAGLKPVALEFKSDSSLSRNDSVVVTPIVKPAADLASVLYFTPADSTYMNYSARLGSALKKDAKVISYEFREYTYGNGKIKSRGFKAKHKYGVNEEYSYKIGTWEFYTKDGALESTVNYNLKEEVVK